MKRKTGALHFNIKEWLRLGSLLSRQGNVSIVGMEAKQVMILKNNDNNKMIQFKLLGKGELNKKCIETSVFKPQCQTLEQL